MVGEKKGGETVVLPFSFLKKEGRSIVYVVKRQEEIKGLFGRGKRLTWLEGVRNNRRQNARPANQCSHYTTHVHKFSIPYFSTLLRQKIRSSQNGHLGGIEATHKQSNFRQEPGALKKNSCFFPVGSREYRPIFRSRRSFLLRGSEAKWKEQRGRKRGRGGEGDVNIFAGKERERKSAVLRPFPAGNRRRRRPSIGRRGLLKGWGEGTEWHQIVPTLLVFHSFAKNISQRILSHLCRP